VQKLFRRELGKPLSEKAFEALWEFTRGVPFYVQFIGRELARRGGRIGPGEVAAAVEEFLSEEGDILFREEWQRLSPKERKVALALAQGHSSPTRIAEAVGETPNAVSRYLQYLAEKEVAERIGPGCGSYPTQYFPAGSHARRRAWALSFWIPTQTKKEHRKLRIRERPRSPLQELLPRPGEIRQIPDPLARHPLCQPHRSYSTLLIDYQLEGGEFLAQEMAACGVDKRACPDYNTWAEISLLLRWQGAEPPSGGSCVYDKPCVQRAKNA